VVRDDRGNARHQYQGDEVIVRRFERCLSEDVLADTIVKGKLFFFGPASMEAASKNVKFISIEEAFRHFTNAEALHRRRCCGACWRDGRYSPLCLTNSQ
jgi:hypothetical protein